MADASETAGPPVADDEASDVVDKVFSTAELMEHILLNLTTRQLFGVRRTCKTFDQSIEGSVKLQRAMFLLPDATPSTFATDGDPKLNPLLQEHRFKLPESLELPNVYCFGFETELTRYNRSGEGLALGRCLFLEFDRADLLPFHVKQRLRTIKSERKTTEQSWRRMRVAMADPTDIVVKNLVKRVRRDVLRADATLGELLDCLSVEQPHQHNSGMGRTRQGRNLRR